MTKRTTKITNQGITLGSLVTDTITGFTGIAIGRVEFGFGCIHIQIQAQGLTSNGTPIPVQAFDDQRIEVRNPPTKAWKEPELTTIKLGNTVRDTISGIIGVAFGKRTSIDGMVDFIVEQPGLTDEGEPRLPFYARASALEVVTKAELKASKDSAATSGGPMARAASAH